MRRHTNKIRGGSRGACLRASARGTRLRIASLIAMLLLGACATPSPRLRPDAVRDVHLSDFESTEPQRCTPADVPGRHADAAAFFRRAKLVDAKTLHDHYEHASCAALGVLQYQGQTCSWRVTAAWTGAVRCDGHEWLLVCDDCEDLAAHRWWAIRS